jgi:hypothetical protein
MKDCQHTNKEYRIMRHCKQIKYQCLDCGNSVGQPVSHSKFLRGQIDLMPDFDENFRQIKRKEYEDFIKKEFADRMINERQKAEAQRQSSEPMIKSIETEYNGIIFRSKMEAKWAFFMDEIGIKYDYEPETFDLGEGVYYIPDFYLPEIDGFLEIKPEYNPTYSPVDRFALVTKKHIIVMQGNPFYPKDDSPNSSYCYYYDEKLTGDIFTPHGLGEQDNWLFCVCPKCDKASLEASGRLDFMKCGCYDSFALGIHHPKIIKALDDVKNRFRWRKEQ